MGTSDIKIIISTVSTHFWVLDSSIPLFKTVICCRNSHFFRQLYYVIKPSGRWYAHGSSHSVYSHHSLYSHIIWHQRKILDDTSNHSQSIVYRIQNSYWLDLQSKLYFVTWKALNKQRNTLLRLKWNGKCPCWS